MDNKKMQFTCYRLAECILCLVVILLGILYTKDIISLWVILPVFLVVFAAIPILRYLDEKKRGFSGVALALSVGISALPVLVVGIAVLVYFL